MKVTDRNDMELREIRLDLIDLVSPYGVSPKDLWAFDEEVCSLVGADPEIQRKSLNELAEKIRKYYKKQKRVK